MSNSFSRMAATNQRQLKRSCESLLGICAGLLADGDLNDREILFLQTWLSEHDEISHTWPGEVLVIQVRDILSDGLITDEKREHLTKTLSDLIGGTLEETGATSGLSTKLPIDDVSQIVINGCIFCFTGSFLYGTRAACERAITERGGFASPTVRRDVNYLVIGTMASRDWAHTSHGRKIEKAIEYKGMGCQINIIAEDQWMQFLR